MSDIQAISVGASFFQGLNEKQISTFNQLIEQNKFLRESVVTIEESATDRVAELNAELEDADNSIDSLETQIAGLRVEISRLQAQNEDLLEVVDTATESAKMSMMREGNVTKDAEKMIQEKSNALDERINQVEAHTEQKYVALLYEIQDEKEFVENALKEKEAELASTLVVVEHKTSANSSLTKQVKELEDSRKELEEELRTVREELDANAVAALRSELTDAKSRNLELEEAVARLKWRSKEEIDNVNVEMSLLKQSLASAENEQELVSSELVRVMAERDSLEAEVEEIRLCNDQLKERSGEISDLDSLGGGSISISSPSPVAFKSSRGSPTKLMTPLGRPHLTSQQSVRSVQVSVSGGCEGGGEGVLSVTLGDYKAKMAERQAAVEDAQKKYFILMEDMENLRRQHTELVESHMLERKNREKLLKSAQREVASVQKEFRTCQKYAETVEKELAEYLSFHKRQTEIKDTTVEVHKELAKSRNENADLAKQMVDMVKSEVDLKQENKDLQGEVSILLAEVESVQGELDKANKKIRNNAGKWFNKAEEVDSASDCDSDDSSTTSNSSDDGDDVASESQSLQNGHSTSNGHISNSNGTSENGKKKKKKHTSSPPTPKSINDYDAIKQAYLASALNSLDKQRRVSSSSSVNSGASRSSKTMSPRPRNNYNSPSKGKRNGHRN